MSGVLDRLVAAFVAPVEQERRASGGWVEPPTPVPPAIAVLAPPDRAVAAGAAVALASGAAVVAVWGAASANARAPASPRARRLATKLAERGHAAIATGRLIVVALAAPDEAARVEAATEAGTVLVVAGPRDAHVDRMLSDHDLVLVVATARDTHVDRAPSDHDQVLVAADDLVAQLAADSARALGVSAETLALADAPVARALAAAGAGLVAPWRAPIEAALA